MLSFFWFLSLEYEVVNKSIIDTNETFTSFLIVLCVYQVLAVCRHGPQHQGVGPGEQEPGGGAAPRGGRQRARGAARLHRALLVS